MNKPLTSLEFQAIGHQVIDRLAGFLDTIDDISVTPVEDPEKVQQLLGSGHLPQEGSSAETLLEDTIHLLINHSLFNGHPRFMGYITSSALPIGALSDLIAAAINQNVGAWKLSPMASEIERQTIKWIAEFIGYDPDCGGLFVSGGNMANFVGLLTARKSKSKGNIQEVGLRGVAEPMVVYASEETHTWIQKAMDLFGFGTHAIRWITTNERREMDVQALQEAIQLDKQHGLHPFLVIGTAGSVSLGVIDPLDRISEVCRQHDLWLHVDGAYGAPAAGLSTAPESLKALGLADSVALDPHKWLYSALEVGCVLVKDARRLLETFSHHPDYYEFGMEGKEINYHEYGLQNSRGFRALKVWLSFRLLGKQGFIKLIEKDIQLSRRLVEKMSRYPVIKPFMNNLSITTFSYVPEHIQGKEDHHMVYLNELNKKILMAVQNSGDAFISNAVVKNRYLLRACLVNFRTREQDLDVLLDLVRTLGEKLEREMPCEPFINPAESQRTEKPQRT